MVLALNLTPKDYATFGMIMSLIAIFGAVNNSFSLNITRLISGSDVTKSQAEGNKIFINSSLVLMIAGITLFIVAFPFMGVITDALFLEEKFSFLILGLIIVTGLNLSMVNALLEARQAVGFIAGSSIYHTIIKLAFCFLLTAIIPLGIAGALLGLLTAIFLHLILAYFYFYRRGWFQEPTEPFKVFKPIKKALPFTLAANISLATMCNIDILVVRNLFPIDTAANYIVAATLGKSILYIPGGIIIVVFAEASKRIAEDKNISKLLFLTLSGTFITGLAGSMFFYIFSEEILNLFLGQKYSGASYFLSVYGFFIIPLSLILVAEHFLIAQNRYSFTWLLVLSAPFQFILIFFIGDTPLKVIGCISASSLLILTLGLLLNNRFLLNQRINPR